MRSTHLMRPHRCDDARLVRGGDRGVYWQARDGMIVQLAARDERRLRAAERGMHEACAPEGGMIHAVPRFVRKPARAGRAERDRIGAVGVAMALWMRLFAGSA